MARGGRVVIAKGNKVSFWGDKNGQSLTAMMVTELCEYNEKKTTVNCTLLKDELYDI